jgi:hypothetical protein
VREKGECRRSSPSPLFHVLLSALKAANAALVLLRPPNAAAKDAQAGGCQAAASIKAERPFPN